MKHPQLNEAPTHTRHRSGEERPVLWALAALAAISVLGGIIYVVNHAL
jgi:hypothetical protein